MRNDEIKQAAALMARYGEVVISGDQPAFIRTRWREEDAIAPFPPSAETLAEMRRRGMLDDRPGAPGETVSRLIHAGTKQARTEGET